MLSPRSIIATALAVFLTFSAFHITTAETHPSTSLNSYKSHSPLATAPTANANSFIIYDTSVTDGEDTIFLQSTINLSDDVSFDPTNDSLIVSSTILPDISSLQIFGYCADHQQCLNQTIPNYKTGDAIRLNYLVSPTSNLQHYKHMFLVVRLALTEYILIYPVQITMWLTYIFAGSSAQLSSNPPSAAILPHQLSTNSQLNQPPIRTDTINVQRSYFESMTSMYWHSPCSTPDCTTTTNLNLFIEGFHPPNKDDEDIGKKFYALQVKISENVHFVGDFVNDIFCVINYWKYRAITLDSTIPHSTDAMDQNQHQSQSQEVKGNNHIRRLIILLEEPTDVPGGLNNLPWYDLNTLDIKCPVLIEFFGFGRDYLLSIESGLISNLASKSPNFTAQSSNTDLWKSKRFRPMLDIGLKPTTYNNDGTAYTRGFINHDDLPTRTDRILLCGVEVASTVTFSIHQPIVNKWGETVWMSTFPSGADITSKAYLDVFDPSLNDWEIDWKVDHEDTQFVIAENTQGVYDDQSDTSTSSGDLEEFEAQSTAQSASSRFESASTSQHSDNSQPQLTQHDQTSRFHRFINRKQVILDHFAEFSQNPHLFSSLPPPSSSPHQPQQDKPEQSIFSTSVLKTIFRSLTNSKSTHRPHKNYQEPIYDIHQAHPTQQPQNDREQTQQFSQFPTQSTPHFQPQSSPVQQRTCIHIYPFLELERITKGLYWFVVTFRLAPQDSNRYRILSTPSPTTTPQIDQPRPTFSQNERTFETASQLHPQSTLSPLQFNPDDPIRLNDIFYLFSGNHMNAGVGLFNWAYRYTLPIDKPSSFYLTPPTYVPPTIPMPHPTYDCEANAKSKSSLPAFIVNLLPDRSFTNWSFTGNHHTMRTNADHEDLTNGDVKATGDIPLYFEHVYPYNAALPPIHLNIQPPGPVKEKVKTIVLLSMQHHTLQSRRLLSQDLTKNYFFTPHYYVNLSAPVEDCVLKVGKYVASSTTDMIEIPIRKAIHVDTQTFIMVDEFTININPSSQQNDPDDDKTADSIYLSCPGLSFISESKAIFEKPSTFGISFYPDWIISPDPGPHSLFPSSTTTTATRDKPALSTDHGGVAVTKSRFWTVLTTFTVSQARESQCQDVDWPEPKSAWNTSTIALVSVIAVLALAVIIFFIMSTKCVRRRCLSRVSNIFGFNSYDDEYDDVGDEDGAADEQELNQLDIERYNAQLKQRTTNLSSFSNPTTTAALHQDHGYQPPVPMSTAGSTLFGGYAGSISNATSPTLHAPSITGKAGAAQPQQSSTSIGGCSSHHSFQIQLLQQQQQQQHQQQQQQQLATSANSSTQSQIPNNLSQPSVVAPAALLSPTALDFNNSISTTGGVVVGGFTGGGIDTTVNIKDHYAVPTNSEQPQFPTSPHVSNQTSTTTGHNSHTVESNLGVNNNSQPQTSPQYQSPQLTQPQPQVNNINALVLAGSNNNRGKIQKGSKKDQTTQNQLNQNNTSSNQQSQQPHGSKKKVKNNYSDFL